MSLLVVTAPDGTLLSVDTSQVDAWLTCKPVPGARIWRCHANCSSPRMVAQSPVISATTQQPSRSEAALKSAHGSDKPDKHKHARHDIHAPQS